MATSSPRLITSSTSTGSSPSTSEKGHLHFMPLLHQIGVPPTRSQPRQRAQAVFPVPCPGQSEHGPFHPLLCQLRGLPHAAHRDERRVR
jgi:hypothetical protein